MASDPNKPLLKFNDPALARRAKGAPVRMPFPDPVDKAKRDKRLGPKFDKLNAALGAAEDPLTLRQDPAALAPETLLVFEVSGSLITFARAVARIPGLNVVGEEDGPFDEADEAEFAGYLYLAVPDQAAIEQLLSLWKRYSKGRDLGADYRDWGRVFDSLHDLRRWGPKDRVTESDRERIIAEAEDRQTVKLELELVFDKSRERAGMRRAETEAAVRDAGGEILAQATYPSIAYDALLVEVKSQVALATANREPHSLAGDPNVFAVRPQSIFEPLPIEVDEFAPLEGDMPAGNPIAAILDGVPVAGHPVLNGRIVVDDPDDLAALAVGLRVHGTAMSSLVVWGDLLSATVPLSKPILVRPVMFAPAIGDERFRDDRLVVDEIIRAVESTVGEQGDPAYRDNILVFNLSIGDRNRPFFGRVSALARAVDWLANRYGVLFIVSAGNVAQLVIPNAPLGDDFAALAGAARSEACLEGIRDGMAERTILSPGESTNAITVGALHHDTMNHPPTMGLNNHDPHPGTLLPSIVSRLGPGFRRSVKPDILQPGGRLRANSHPTASPVILTATRPTKFGGLKVAGPLPDSTAWSGATSAAAALTTRSAHLINDALERAYEEEFLGLDRRRRALILKALLLHRVSIPEEGRQIVEKVFGPPEPKKWSARRANVQRLFGYGVPDIDEAIGCIDSRATLWGHGSLGVDQAQVFDLPLPISIFGNRTVRKVTATLAWFSPIVSGMRSYKAVRLDIEEPDELDILGVDPLVGQVPKVAAARGTILHRAWAGKKLRAAVDDGAMRIHVARKPDPTGDEIDESVDFGLAVSIESDDPELPVYVEVREQLAIQPRIPVAVPV